MHAHVYIHVAHHFFPINTHIYSPPSPYPPTHTHTHITQILTRRPLESLSIPTSWRRSHRRTRMKSLTPSSSATRLPLRIPRQLLQRPRPSLRPSPLSTSPTYSRPFSALQRISQQLLVRSHVRYRPQTSCKTFVDAQNRRSRLVRSWSLSEMTGSRRGFCVAVPCQRRIKTDMSLHGGR